MENNCLYQYTKIRKNIWQIAEDHGVFCTLIQGTELAVLIDTGYGHRNLRAFVEKNINTPYLVFNSHGHPDHIGGNHWFDVVWAVREEWDVIRHFEEKSSQYERREILAGSQISLGDLHVEFVSLAGHTKGSIGFLVPEERMLIAGDALNESLWLFNYGSLSMKQLYDTINRALHMNFDTYLCGHSHQEYRKEKLFAHINNIDNLKVDEETKQNLLGFETYSSVYEDGHGRSEIIYTPDRI